MSIKVGMNVQIIPSRMNTVAGRNYWQGRTGKVVSVNPALSVAFINFSGEEGCFRFDLLREIKQSKQRRKYTNLRIQDIHGAVHVLENLVGDDEPNGVSKNPTVNWYKSTNGTAYFSQDYLNDKVASGGIKILGVGNAPKFTVAANDVYEDVIIAAKNYSQLEKFCVYKVNMNNNQEGYFTHVRKVDVGAWLCVAKGIETFEDEQPSSYRDKGTRWFLVKEKDLDMPWLVGDDLATFTPANEWPSMSEGLEKLFTNLIEGNY